MLVAAEHAPELAQTGRGAAPLGREKPLFRPAQPQQGRVDAGGADLAGFDRPDERLERRRLQLEIAAADQDAVTARADRLDRRRGYRDAGADRFHLEIIAQDDAIVAEL